jgi:uncharacterized membrane protein
MRSRSVPDPRTGPADPPDGDTGTGGAVRGAGGETAEDSSGGVGLAGAAAPTRWARWGPWALAAAFTALYALLSVARYERLADTSWDLSIFEESVRHYAHFQAPVVDIKGRGYDIMGDHFSPIVALLGPLFLIWPSGVTLLLAQAALLGVSAVPIGRAAVRRLGTGPGLWLTVAYGLAWGLQRTADNTFHEVAFAVPLLAFGMEHLLERRWGTAALWCLPLVLVKEDLGLTVAAVGVYLLIRRQDRLGAALVVYGTAWFVLTLYVFIPAVNPSGHYDYWSKVGSTGTGPGGATAPAGGGGGGPGLSSLAHIVDGSGTKLTTLVVILGVTGLLALRSPLCVLLLPTLLWRFVSTDTAYWGTAWHYSAVLMPVVFAALLDAVESARTSRFRALRGYAAAAVPVAVAVAVTFTLAGPLPLDDLLHSATYGRAGARGPAARHAVAEVPDGVTVETNVTLMSHLAARCDVFWVGDTGGLDPDYVALDEWVGWSSPITDPVGYVRGLHPGATYTLTSNDQGFAVLRRISPPIGR